MIGKHILLAAAVSLALVSQAGQVSADDCGASLIAKSTGWMNRGLNQNKIPGLMSQYYSAEQLGEFRKMDREIADSTFARNRGRARSQIFPAPGIEKHLNSIADRLLQQWPYEVPDYRILVTSTAYYGALTSQDGIILVPAGLIDAASSEDELAFTLAHELGHILFLHAKEAAENAETIAALRNLYKDVSGTLGLTGDVKAASNDGELPEDDRKRLEKLQQRSSAYYDYTRELVTEFIHPSWQKHQEDEADLIGLELLVRAGYSFDGVRQTFVTMKGIEKSACQELQRFSKRMQSYAENELKQGLEELESGSDQEDFADDFLKGAEKLVKRGIRGIVQQQALPKTHRPYKKRLKYIQEFGKSEAMSDAYDAAYDRDASEGVLAAIKSSPEYSSLVSSTKAAYKVREALEAGDTALAASQLKAVNMNTQNGRLLKYRLRMQQGKQSAAEENLALALNSDYPSLDVVVKAITHKLEAGKYSQAQSLVERAEKVFGDDHYFQPERVYLVQKTAADAADATRAQLNSCLASGRDDMDGPCHAAALGTSAGFREQYEQILSAVDCSTNSDTGGDISCEQDDAIPKENLLTKFLSR